MPDPHAPLFPAALAGDAGFYFAGEDGLRIASLNSVASVRLRVNGRFLDARTGRVVPFSEMHVPNTDRTLATSDITLAEGWLQNLTIVVEGAAPTLSAVFVQVDVIRGRGGAAGVVATLVQGVVTAVQRRAWPGSALETTVAQPGILRSLAGTNPAAGVEISETVPTGARWRLHAFQASLVTDATVANRDPSLVFDDGATAFATVPMGRDQTASTTHVHTWALGAQRTVPANNTRNVTAAPAILLSAGCRIRTVTNNLQAGDNWGAPQLLVEEWLEGA